MGTVVRTKRQEGAAARLFGSVAVALLLAGCGTSARSQGGAPSQTSAVRPASSTATDPGSGRQEAPTTETTGTRPEARKPSVHYVFPVRGCRVSYGHSHHDYPATDIFAARGCAFVSPVDGFVDEVSRVDRWDPSSNRGADRGGRFVSVLGRVDGVRYYGSHLEAVAKGIAPGVRVRPGQLLGRVGNSGDARQVATHLHFGISWETPSGTWWIRRGWIYPWPFLDAWRAGRDRSPTDAVVAALKKAGSSVPACQVDC